MANVFHTSLEIHKRYDIKGSLFHRYTKEKLALSLMTIYAAGTLPSR